MFSRRRDLAGLPQQPPDLALDLGSTPSTELTDLQSCRAAAHRVWTQQDVLELRLFLVDRAATCPLTTLEDRGLAIMPKMCEDCEKKHASCGTPTEGKRRWC
jgi:hypothetical protein